MGLENNKEKSKLINNSGQAQEQVMEVRSKAEKTLMWRKNEEDREKNKTMYGSVIDDTYYETNYLLNNHTESDDNAECKKLDMVRHRSISASEVETRLLITLFISFIFTWTQHMPISPYHV